MGGVVALDNHVPPLPDQMVERSISDTPLEELTTPRSKSPGDACEKSPNARLERRSRQRDSDVSTADTTGSSRPSISSVPDIAEVQSLLSEVEDDTTPCSNLSQCSQEMMSTSRCPSDGAWTFDEACEKSPNARLEVRSRLSGQSGVSTADTTGADMPSARSEVEDDTTPCSNLSQCSQEMMSTHTFAPSSLAPGANACQCSQVEWQLWWQSLAYEGACQKNLEQQQWLQQVEAQNNELTVLVAALRAEKRVLEQRLFRCDDELFEAKECLMAEFIQHRALQKELEREREICSGARCRNEKLQSMYEDACQQRDQETMQVELCRQQLQRVETRNDELTALVSALEAAKERLEQRTSPMSSAWVKMEEFGFWHALPERQC